MSNIDKIKEKYVTDVDAMAQKPRFGYFSILPSHTAGITDFGQKKIAKDSDGKIITEERNLFSGTCSSGMMKKSYFSYVPSAFHGSVFEDPAKIQRRQDLLKSQTWREKEIFKPAKLNKTLASASYQYIEQKTYEKTKNHRDTDGRVKTSSPNIKCNIMTKIQFQKIRKFKYSTQPFGKAAELKKLQLKKEQTLRGEQPFRAGNPCKNFFFSTNSEAFFDTNIKAKLDKKQGKMTQTTHDAPFRTTYSQTNRAFNPIVYKEQGTSSKSLKKENLEKGSKQVFKYFCYDVGLQKSSVNQSHAHQYPVPKQICSRAVDIDHPVIIIQSESC